MLAEWLKTHCITVSAFARLLNVRSSSVESWVNNRFLPDLVNAFKIEKLTEGGVPVASWLGTPIGKARWDEATADWAREDYKRTHRRVNNEIRAKRAKYMKRYRDNAKLAEHLNAMSSGSPDTQPYVDRPMYTGPLRSGTTTETVAGSKEGDSAEGALSNSPPRGERNRPRRKIARDVFERRRELIRNDPCGKCGRRKQCHCERAAEVT